MSILVRTELEELGAAARALVVPRMELIVGKDRYEKSVAYSERLTESDNINLTTDDLTYAAYAARLESLEAEAARVEAASLPVRLDLALTVVLEDAEGKKASFFDIRYAVSRQISDAFPAEAAELASAAKCAVSKVLARKVRAHKGGAGMDLSRPCLLGYRVKPADVSLPQLVQQPAGADGTRRAGAGLRGAALAAGVAVAVAVAVAGEEAFAEEEEVSARRWGGLMLLCVIT